MWWDEYIAGHRHDDDDDGYKMRKQIEVREGSRACEKGGQGWFMVGGGECGKWRRDE